MPIAFVIPTAVEFMLYLRAEEETSSFSERRCGWPSAILRLKPRCSLFAARMSDRIENRRRPTAIFGGRCPRQGHLHFALFCIIFAKEYVEAPFPGIFFGPQSRFTPWATVKTVAQGVISLAQVVISVAQVVLFGARKVRRVPAGR